MAALRRRGVGMPVVKLETPIGIGYLLVEPSTGAARMRDCWGVAKWQGSGF
jgi:hypothetical protein